MPDLFTALARLYPSIAADVTARRCDKHKHKSPGAAEAQRRSMLNTDRGGLIDPDTLYVYECLPKCGPGVWHIGHDKRRGARHG